MKTVLTTILLLFAFVAFGQRHPIEAGKGVIITEKDGVLSISMDTTKPCDRCPKFTLDSFDPVYDTIYVVSYDLVEKQALPNEWTETIDKFGRTTYDTYLLYRYKTIYRHQERKFTDGYEASVFFMDANRQSDIANLVLDTFLKLKELKQ